MDTSKLCPNPIEIVTLTESFTMDCETPVSLYLKLAMEKPHGFILESVEHGQHSGRFSFVGWNPILHFSFEPYRLTCEGIISGCLETEQPLAALKRLFSQVKMLDGRQEAPGARLEMVGHIGYDAIRLVEDIGPYRPNPDSAPWIDLIFPSNVVVLDHLNHVVTLICHQPVEESEPTARKTARRRLSEILKKIRTFSVANHTIPFAPLKVTMDNWETNLSKSQFCEMVRRAKGHIIDGDIFQVVLSRVVRRDFPANPFDIYRVLRQINPSPYMFFLRQGERTIVGGSPESLVTLENGLLSTKPIAGTRPRGRDLEEDLALEKDLLADEKEIAEHVMLVDLGRNDLGRIAASGTVSVPRLMTIERYSHVMHIVSVVQAKLRQGFHALDALMSVFPAGTLSGAPKIRAMQIINEFEPEVREVYGGAIGFLNFSGNMDSCIAIRTATVHKGVVRVQAGAGIVADSVPEKEFDETTHKMMSMVAAVERALHQATYS